jgi:hypothetical protein
MRALSIVISSAFVLAIGACTSDSSPGGAGLPGGSDVPALDGSALADTPAVDTGNALAEDTGEPTADEGENLCPERPPESGSSCEGDATCKYGQDCCCGECHDALVCTCGSTKWGCYFTDACLLPPCVDAGSLDTGASSDAGATDTGAQIDAGAEDAGAPDTGSSDGGPPEDSGSAATLPEGKCRSDGDCERDMESCHGPGDPMNCGICRQLEQPCTEDSDCEGERVCDFGREGCPPCDWGKECVAKCGGTAGCREGETCDEAGHCVDKPCANDQDCPELFLCNSSAEAPVCKRRSCQDDAGCPAGGHCVNGTCWPTFGSCMLPAA